MIPTRRTLMLLAAGIPIAALGAAAGIASIGLLYDLIIALAALASWYLAPSTKGLKVLRRFDPVLSVRVPNRVLLSIENDGVECIRGRLRDEPPPDFEVDQQEFVFQIAPQKLQEFSYNVTPYVRGGDFFRGTYLRLECPLGLVEKQVKLHTEQPVRVYPNVLALREFDLLKQQGRLREIGIRRSRIRGLGTEFESLREYAEGDDYRKIDWKASARRGKLVVRQFEQERNQVVMVVVDVGRHMLAEVDGVRKLDRTLDATLMLTHAAVSAGDNVGLLVYGDVVRRYIPPRKGRRQMGVVIDALHDLMAEPIESDMMGAISYLASRWKRRSLLVVFTDIDCPPRAKEVAAALGTVSNRHLTVVARVSDPQLKEGYDAPVTGAEAWYRRSASAILIEDRRKAGMLLGASGIESLEAEPDDLSNALVSFYFAAKDRSLI